MNYTVKTEIDTDHGIYKAVYFKGKQIYMALWLGETDDQFIAAYLLLHRKGPIMKAEHRLKQIETLLRLADGDDPQDYLDPERECELREEREKILCGLEDMADARRKGEL